MTARLCPGCNLPAQPVRFIAATATHYESAGVIGLCHRCTVALRVMPPTRRRIRILALADKALAKPGRYLATPFETPNQAHIAAAIAQHDPGAMNILGWMNDEIATEA